ncbi:MAG: ABC transporter ATP-binding protein [Nitrososphaerales archaeon]
MSIHKEVILKIENVSTVYEGERKPAIKDINLTVNVGELIYIVGPNGAGKTTLLETINGLLPYIKGRVFVFGMDLQKNGRKIRSRIGYVPQDFMVEPDEPFTALDVVLMGLYGKLGLIAKPTNNDVDKAYRVMKLLGIEDLAKRPIGKLSGGQQQKVMIARALAKEPEILLLDEPFSNLDPKSREMVISIIKNLNDHGLTTLIVTHDIKSIIENCRRIVIMMDGRIIADAPMNEAKRIFEYSTFHTHVYL